jgi:hypothetical protein
MSHPPSFCGICHSPMVSLRSCDGLAQKFPGDTCRSTDGVHLHTWCRRCNFSARLFDAALVPQPVFLKAVVLKGGR